MPGVERSQVLARARASGVQLRGVRSEQLQEATTFDEDLGLDSLSLVEWTLALEEIFDVELPEEDVTALPSFGGLVDLLVRQLDRGGQHGSS